MRIQARGARAPRSATALAAALVLPLAFLLAGCGDSAPPRATGPTDPYQIGPQPSPTRIAALQQPGSWHRANAQTLTFDGTIGPGSARGLAAALTPATTTLQVDSPGGDADEALAAADTIQQHRLALDVTTVCAGPCADYWFTAASTRTTEPGSWLGFTPRAGDAAKEAALFAAAGVNAEALDAAIQNAVATAPDQPLPAANPPGAAGPVNAQQDQPASAAVEMWMPTRADLAALGFVGLDHVNTPVTLTAANTDAHAWGIVARYENTVVGLSPRPLASAAPVGATPGTGGTPSAPPVNHAAARSR